jgi:transposase
MKTAGYFTDVGVGILKGVVASQAILEGGSSKRKRLSNRDLAAMLGCSEMTVRRRGLQAIDVGARLPSESPRKQDKRTPEKKKRQVIIDEIMTEERGKVSAQDIANKLFVEHHIVVTRRTVCRDLQEAGWKLKRRPSCPNMRTPEAMAKRLDFSKKMLTALKNKTFDPLDFVFTDESISTSGSGAKVMNNPNRCQRMAGRQSATSSVCCT